MDRAPLSYFCCPSGHTQYPTAEEHFYGNIHCRKNTKISQDIHNILLLRKSTTTFLWKQTSKSCKKNTKNLRTYTIFRCLQNFFRAPEVPFFVFSQFILQTGNPKSFLRLYWMFLLFSQFTPQLQILSPSLSQLH